MKTHEQDFHGSDKVKLHLDINTGSVLPELLVEDLIHIAVEWRQFL
jgi:hypothetical protein